MVQSLNIQSDRAVNGAIRLALEQAQPSPLPQLLSYMNMNSDQLIEPYGWQGAVRPFSEDSGQTKISTTTESKFQVTNKTFTGAILNTFEDRQFNRFRAVEERIQGLQNESLLQWDDFLSTLLKTAETTKCYDGQYFFDTDHQTGTAPAWSNITTVDLSSDVPTAVDNKGTATNPSPFTLGHAISMGVQNMMEVTNDRGRYINYGAKQFTVVVSTNYMAALGQTKMADAVNIGQANIEKALGSFGLNFNFVAFPYLNDWTSQFAMFRTDGVGSNKPFVMQQAGSMEIERKDDPEKLHNWIHSAAVLRGFGFGLPELAMLVKLVA